MKKLIIVAIALIFAAGGYSQNISAKTISLDCKTDVTLGKGYTHSQIFILKGEKFLFSHNSKTGQTDIWNLEVGGLPKYSKKWSTGWTNLNFYKFQNDVYFFHQKGGEGTARINKLSYDNIMANKNMGPKVYESKWSKGWSNTKFFVYNDVVYFFHYKKESGLARLNAATKGGDVGKKIYEKKWSTGYTNFDMTVNNGNFYFLYQKGGEGTCVINKMDLSKIEAAAKAGLLTPNLGTEVYRKKWSAGWSNIHFFKLNGVTYMFLNKSGNGTARIEEITEAGTPGTRVYDKKWSSGWTEIDILYTNGQPHLFHQKKSTGQTKICLLKN